MQRELCRRIDETLARSPIHDHLGYEALAYLKLPGPDYKAVLGVMHRAIKPRLYVEIGVRRGDTLALAGPDTHLIGIDPNPQLGDFPIEGRRLSMNVTTSDRFFQDEKRRETARGFDLAFIDGDHDARQVQRDFNNLESLAGKHSMIVLHDVIPMDARTSTPDVQSSFHTGDAWRAMAGLVARRDMRAFTIACPPTGLGVVSGFGHWDLNPELPLDMDWDVLVKRLNIVANEPSAITAALARAVA